MTAVEKQILSKDICQINTGVDKSLNDTGDEAKRPSPDVYTCNSRFFRRKGNQCLLQNPLDIDETEILLADIQSSVEKSKMRSSEPAVRLTNGNECSTAVVNRPSLLTTHSSNGRKKSHSVKLTRHNGNQSCPKKVVHFADDFGLELSQMKLINTDEFPCVPSEAFKHLQISSKHRQSDSERVKVIASIVAQFENPMYKPNFNDHMSRDKIILEQANAIDNRIYGTARLISLGLHKRVKVRLTTNNWISFEDYDAVYINNSYDGHCDRFAFTVEIVRHRICIGNTIQFCLCYQSFDGVEYWDNNYHQNYRFNCCPRTIPEYETSSENRLP